MKKTELRLGNYISDHHASDTYFAPVQKLDYQVCFYGKGTQALFHSAYSDLKPIPLTEQWLLDFGFNQNIENRWYLHFHDVCLTLYEDSEQYMVQIHDMEIDESSIFLKSIQYVHQLQNLYFTLTEENLIFKK